MLINNLSKEILLIMMILKDSVTSLDALNKYVHIRRSILEVIKCPSLIKNYRT